MFGSIGMPELLIIFVIALIIFGPRKLPELGKSLGRSLSEFKRASNDLRNTLEEEIRIEDKRPDEEPRPKIAKEVEATPPRSGFNPSPGPREQQERRVTPPPSDRRRSRAASTLSHAPEPARGQ